jgi:hypothetical protein
MMKYLLDMTEHQAAMVVLGGMAVAVGGFLGVVDFLIRHERRILRETHVDHNGMLTRCDDPYCPECGEYR